MLQKIPSVPKEIVRRKYVVKAERYENGRDGMVSWMNSHVGRCVKAVLGAYAEYRNPNLHMDGKYKENGLTAPLVFDWACTVMPWLPAWFKEQAGRELTPALLFDRLHKQFYSDRVIRRSREHYTLDPKLRAYITFAENTVIKNKPIPMPLERA